MGLTKTDLFMIGAGSTTIITIVGVTVAIIYAPVAAIPIALIGTTIATMLAYDVIKNFFQTLVSKLYHAGADPIGERETPPESIEGSSLSSTPSAAPELHTTHVLRFTRHESETSIHGTHRTSDAEEVIIEDLTSHPHKPGHSLTKS